MQAVAFDAFGGPERLRIAELPVPTPGPGEVVVAVAAAPINPTDRLMLAGAQAKMMEGLAPPFIAGMEFSGHVHTVGAGVDIAPGIPIIGVVNPRRPEGGAHSQYVKVSSASIAPVSAETDLIAASCVLMNGLTAKLAFDFLDLTSGQSVLVTGGAGMLGGYAIQLAKRAGLRVVADAADSDAPYLKTLGVDVIAPRGAAARDVVRSAFPAGVDGLIDAALISAEVSSLVRDGGAAVSVRKSHPIEDKRLRAGSVMVTTAMQDKDALRFMADLVERGELTPRVARIYDFQQAADAFQQSASSGLRGRIVLRFAR